MGVDLLKFHSGLLAQAMDGGAPVTAAYLRYSWAEENGPGVRWRTMFATGEMRQMLAAYLSSFWGCAG